MGNMLSYDYIYSIRISLGTDAYDRSTEYIMVCFSLKLYG